MKNWLKVYKFTFMQTVKNKFLSKIMLWITVIAFIGILLANVIPAMNDVSNDIDSGTLKNISVLNDTEIDSHLFVSTVDGYENIKFVKSQDSLDEATSKIKTGDESEGFLYITKEDVGYKLKLIVSPSIKMSSEYENKVLNALKVSFDSIRLYNAGVPEEQIQDLLVNVQTSVLSADDAEMNQYLGIIKLAIRLMVACILMIVFILFGDSIASSVAQEKFSKVIELLLTSAKPIDIVIGKVLAMVTVVMFQVGVVALSIISSLYLSVKAMEYINPEYSNIVTKILDYIKESGMFNNVSVIDIILILISFLIGTTFFFLFAALTGAVIKKPEDMAIGLLPYELLSVTGIIVLAYLNNNSNAAIETLCRYFPITSPYLLPIDLLLGNISAMEATISILILIMSTFMLIKVISAIYISVILYNGQKIDVKKILKAIKI